MNKKLAIEYFESILGKPLSQFPPMPVSGWEVVEILWPLNEIFRPLLYRIRSIRYDERFESAADKAIEKYIKLNNFKKAWDGLPGEVWRVLLERHIQLLAVALANEMAGNPVTVLPPGLPDSARLSGIMLLLLHGMKLPWPPEDRSEFEFPEGGPHPSLRLH